MLSPETKDWISVVTAVASAASAIIALAIAVWVFVQQRRLQRQQLRQDLFDKRFAVYAAVETLMVDIIRLTGSVTWTDQGKFLAAIEPAEFLFGADVTAYLGEIQELVKALSGKEKEGTTQNTYGEDVIAETPERTAILQALGSLNKRSNEVFGPYLVIHED